MKSIHDSLQEGWMNPVGQGLIWGLSSSAATRATQEKSKEESKEDRKKRLRQIALAGLIGAGAGTASTYLPDLIKSVKKEK